MVSTTAAGPPSMAGTVHSVPARPRGLRRYAWRYVSGLGLAAVLTGPLLPWGIATQALYGLVGLATIAAAVFGIRLHRPAPARPWWLLVAALSTATLGNVYWAVEFALTGLRIPFGSPG